MEKSSSNKPPMLPCPYPNWEDVKKEVETEWKNDKHLVG